MPKSMLIAQSILTSGPGLLTLYDCQTTVKNRKVSLNTNDGAAVSSRQGGMCMSKEYSSRDEDHEVGYIHRMKPVKHPKPKEATV